MEQRKKTQSSHFKSQGVILSESQSGKINVNIGGTMVTEGKSHVKEADINSGDGSFAHKERTRVKAVSSVSTETRQIPLTEDDGQQSTLTTSYVQNSSSFSDGQPEVSIGSSRGSFGVSSSEGSSGYGGHTTVVHGISGGGETHVVSTDSRTSVDRGSVDMSSGTANLGNSRNTIIHGITTGSESSYGMARPVHTVTHTAARPTGGHSESSWARESQFNQSRETFNRGGVASGGK